jgi:hypothetical protein
MGPYTQTPKRPGLKLRLNGRLFSYMSVSMVEVADTPQGWQPIRSVAGRAPAAAFRCTRWFGGSAGQRPSGSVPFDRMLTELYRMRLSRRRWRKPVRARAEIWEASSLLSQVRVPFPCCSTVSSGTPKEDLRGEVLPLLVAERAWAERLPLQAASPCRTTLNSFPKEDKKVRSAY